MVGILESSARNSQRQEPNWIAQYSMEAATGGVIDSINAYNGAIVGSVTRGATGFIGNCFDFVNGEVRVPDNPDFRLNDGTSNKNLEFSFYVNLDTVKDTWFFNKRSASNNEYQFTYLNGALRLQIWNTDGTQLSYSSNRTFSANTWYKLSGRTEIATNNIIIKRDDVILPGTISGTAKTFNVTVEDFVFGKAAWDNVFALDGRMDELKIYTG